MNQNLNSSALGSVSAIAAGLVETTLARSIPVALGFLSKVLGIGNMGGKIRAVIEKVRGKLDRVLDKVIARVKTVIEKITGKGSTKTDGQVKPGAPNTEKDKKAVLNAGVAAIRPQFLAMVNRRAPVKELKGNLVTWRTQHNLARVWMTREQGPFALKAKVNPEDTLGTAMTPGDTELRSSAREAVNQLMKSPAVQARAQHFAAQAQHIAAQGDLAGSATSPFAVSSGLDTLALLVYSRQTKVTPERPIAGLDKRPKGQSETHFDYGNGLTAQHGQWQAGTNTFVRKMGNYNEIAEMMAGIKARTRRSDALIATDIQEFVRSGLMNPIYSGQERQQLTALRHLMTYSESVRSPDNAAHSMMVLDRIAAGQADWKSGLQELPMHIKDAAGAKRGLELLDQSIENVSPKAAQMLRKFMPSIAILRQKEADLIRKWMDTMKSRSDSLFRDKADMSNFIHDNMNRFYGGS